MAYVDLTTTYETSLRLDWQEFDERDENDVFKHLDSTTVMFFGQVSAPTGWTKQVAQNDKALRVVSGAGGGSGGTIAMSTGLTLVHTHTVDSHTHTTTAHEHLLDFVTIMASRLTDRVMTSGNNDGDDLTRVVIGEGTIEVVRKIENITKLDGSGQAGGGTAPETDSQLIDTTFSYYDVIACAKDVGVFTDLSVEFGYKELLTHQLMDSLAENDLYDNIGVSNVVTFFQASAPTNWTKLTTQNDKALRVVSGGTGGTAGGTVGFSSEVTLAHTHTVDNHLHTLGNHQHILDYTTDTLKHGGVIRTSADSAGSLRQDGSTVAGRQIKNQTEVLFL